MLSRMIARLLLKTVLAAVLLLGVVSYGHHLAGGDPGAIWSRVAGGAFHGIARSVGELRGAVRAPAAALAGGARGDSRHENVWTWRDADGAVHYASAPPAGSGATRLTLDPDANVLAPVASPAVADPPSAAGRRSTGADARRTLSRRERGGADDAEALPGIAGAAGRARGDASAPDPAKAEALLKLLGMPAR